MQVNDQTHRPDLAAVIRGASDLLKETLGPSAERVRADWSLSQDEMGRAFVELRVSDWTGSVGYRFSPDELSNPSHMERRLHRLWGDLLMVRSHVQLDDYHWQLQESGGQ